MPPVYGSDPSVYQNLGRGGNENLLGPVTSFAYAQNALNQNQLFQQTFRARQAMGLLAQQSIDPETGQIDYNKFALAISTHPETAFMAPEIINQLVQRQLTQAQLVKTNLDIEATRRGVINNALAGLTNLGQNVKKSDIMGAMTSPEMNGIIPMKQAVAMLSTLPPDGPQLATWVQSHALASAGASDALNYVRGTWQEATNPDGSKTGGFVSPISGFSPMRYAGGSAPGATGAPAPAQPQSAGGGGGGGGAGGGELGELLPPLQAQTPQPQPQPAAPAVPNAGGQPPAGSPGAPMITSLSPYRTAALGDVAKYETDLNSRAGNANNLIALMGQVQGYLKHFQAGGGEELRGEMAQLAQAVGAPTNVVDQISRGNLGDVQAARKLFFGIGSQIAAQIIHNSGGRMTQTEWAQTLLRGSPNIDLDPRAISKIMGSMRDLASYSRQEQNFFNMKKSLPNYDMTRAQNDWQNTYGAYLDQKYGAQ